MGQYGITFDQGAQLASQAIDNVTGIALSKGSVKRQIKGQKELMEEQARHAKELGEYQQGKQLEMWKNTGVVGQMEQLKKAGLNPGLIYGMSGAGGATTGGGMNTSVSGGNVDVTGSIGMGIQMATLQSQKNLLDAQTAKTMAEATKIGGVDTTKTGAEIQNLNANTNNQEANTKLTRLNAQMQEMKNYIQNNTLDESVDEAIYRSRQAGEQLEEMERKNEIGSKTKDDEIKTVHQNYLNMIAEAGLLKAQTKGTNANTIKAGAETVAIDSERRMNIQRSIGGLLIKWAEVAGKPNAKQEIEKSDEYQEIIGVMGTLGTQAIMRYIFKIPAPAIKGFKFW